MRGTDYILMTVVYSSVILLTLTILLPFIIIFFQSVTPQEAMIGSQYTLLPSKLDFAAYEYLLFGSQLIIKGFGNSMFLVIVGTLFSLSLTTMAAYTLSKRYLPYRKFLTYLVYIPMIIGGGLIPTYMVVRLTGLTGSLWACIIPGAVSSWNLFLMRNFFYGIPAEMEEAAMIDGASDATVFFGSYFQFLCLLLQRWRCFMAWANGILGSIHLFISITANSGRCSWWCGRC